MIKNLNITEIGKKRILSCILAGTMLVCTGTLNTKAEALDENTTAITESIYPTSTLVEENISVYKGVNIYVDDHSYIPKDVNGNEVAPFIYNGTTYLPARAIANVYGADIKWDNDSKSVFIGEKKGITDYGQTRENTKLYQEDITAYKGVNIYVKNKLYVPTDANGNKVDVYIYNGTTYLPVRAIANVYGVDIAWDDATKSVYIGKHIAKEVTKPNANYTQLELEAIDTAKNFDYYYGCVTDSADDITGIVRIMKKVINEMYNNVSETMAEPYADRLEEQHQIIKEVYIKINENLPTVAKKTYKYISGVLNAVNDDEKIDEETLKHCINKANCYIEEFKELLKDYPDDKRQAILDEIDKIVNEFENQYGVDITSADGIRTMQRYEQLVLK